MLDCSSQKNLFPEKIHLFQTISFLARTVDLRVEDIWNNINSQLKNKANDLEWFSLALDEPTDVIDTTQLLFIQGVSAKFEVAERPVLWIVFVEQLQRRISSKLRKYQV